MFTPLNVSDVDVERWLEALFTIPHAMQINYELTFLIEEHTTCTISYAKRTFLSNQRSGIQKVELYGILFRERNLLRLDAHYQHLDRISRLFIGYMRTLPSLDREFVRMLWQHNLASLTKN